MSDPDEPNITAFIERQQPVQQQQQQHDRYHHHECWLPQQTEEYRVVQLIDPVEEHAHNRNLLSLEATCTSWMRSTKPHVTELLLVLPE